MDNMHYDPLPHYDRVAKRLDGPPAVDDASLDPRTGDVPARPREPSASPPGRAPVTERTRGLAERTEQRPTNRAT